LRNNGDQVLYVLSPCLVAKGERHERVRAASVPVGLAPRPNTVADALDVDAAVPRAVSPGPVGRDTVRKHLLPSPVRVYVVRLLLAALAAVRGVPVPVRRPASEHEWVE
jgi:hypothetical protein